MDRLLDRASLGPTYLRQPEIAELVLDVLMRGVDLGHYKLHAWVVMPNHVHLLLRPLINLSRLLGSLKTALLGRGGQPFWQGESFDHLVRNEAEFRRIMRYIETNPVVAGLAERQEAYRWSSAGAARVAALL